MTSDDRFERLLADVLAEVAPTREPDRLVPEILRAARRERRWPRWLALTKEPPMRVSSRVAVGSPTLRLASIMAITLALVLAATGAVAVGASLLPSPAVAPTRELTIGVTKPIGITSDGVDLWTVGATGQVIRIDPDTNTASVVGTIDPALLHGGLAVDQAGVWAVDDNGPDLVYRLDPATLEVVATIPVGTQPQGVVIADGAVWVTNHHGGSVSRIDPATNQVVATIATGSAGASGPHAPYIGLGSVWTGVPNVGAIFRVDQATNEVLAKIIVPAQVSACGGFAFGEQAVWMNSCQDTNFMVRIDPATNKPVATVDLGGWGDDPVLVDGFPWMVVESPYGLPGRLVRIDPATNTIDRDVSRGDRFMGGNLLVAAGSVWMNDWANDQIVRMPMTAFE